MEKRSSDKKDQEHVPIEERAVLIPTVPIEAVTEGTNLNRSFNEEPNILQQSRDDLARVKAAKRKFPPQETSPRQTPWSFVKENIADREIASTTHKKSKSTFAREHESLKRMEYNPTEDARPCITEEIADIHIPSMMHKEAKPTQMAQPFTQEQKAKKRIPSRTSTITRAMPPPRLFVREENLARQIKSTIRPQSKPTRDAQFFLREEIAERHSPSMLRTESKITQNVEAFIGEEIARRHSPSMRRMEARSNRITQPFVQEQETEKEFSSKMDTITKPTQLPRSFVREEISARHIKSAIRPQSKPLQNAHPIIGEEIAERHRQSTMQMGAKPGQNLRPFIRENKTGEKVPSKKRTQFQRQSVTHTPPEFAIFGKDKDRRLHQLPLSMDPQLLKRTLDCFFIEVFMPCTDSGLNVQHLERAMKEAYLHTSPSTQNIPNDREATLINFTLTKNIADGKYYVDRKKLISRVMGMLPGGASNAAESDQTNSSVDGDSIEKRISTDAEYNQVCRNSLGDVTQTNKDDIPNEAGYNQVSINSPGEGTSIEKLTSKDTEYNKVCRNVCGDVTQNRKENIPKAAGYNQVGNHDAEYNQVCRNSCGDVTQIKKEDIPDKAGYKQVDINSSGDVGQIKKEDTSNGKYLVCKNLTDNFIHIKTENMSMPEEYFVDENALDDDCVFIGAEVVIDGAITPPPQDLPCQKQALPHVPSTADENTVMPCAVLIVDDDGFCATPLNLLELTWLHKFLVMPTNQRESQCNDSNAFPARKLRKLNEPQLMDLDHGAKTNIKLELPEPIESQSEELAQPQHNIYTQWDQFIKQEPVIVSDDSTSGGSVLLLSDEDEHHSNAVAIAASKWKEFTKPDLMDLDHESKTSIRLELPQFIKHEPVIVSDDSTSGESVLLLSDEEEHHGKAIATGKLRKFIKPELMDLDNDSKTNIKFEPIEPRLPDFFYPPSKNCIKLEILSDLEDESNSSSTSGKVDLLTSEEKHHIKLSEFTKPELMDLDYESKTSIKLELQRFTKHEPVIVSDDSTSGESVLLLSDEEEHHSHAIAASKLREFPKPDLMDLDYESKTSNKLELPQFVKHEPVIVCEDSPSGESVLLLSDEEEHHSHAIADNKLRAFTKPELIDLGHESKSSIKLELPKPIEPQGKDLSQPQHNLSTRCDQFVKHEPVIISDDGTSGGSVVLISDEEEFPKPELLVLDSDSNTSIKTLSDIEVESNSTSADSELPGSDELEELDKPVEPCEPNPTEDVFKRCKDIIKEMFSPKYSRISTAFLVPSKKQIHQLTSDNPIIKNPIGLGLVQRRLTDGLYDSPLKFATDVRTVFCNCYKFYAPDHKMVDMARILHTLFEERFSSLFKDQEYDSSDGDLNLDD